MERKPIVVYAEDDTPSITVMKMLMRKVLGITDTLIVIESTESFLEQVKRIGTTPDLFLLDIHILPYDGFDLLAMIREDPQLCESKVVALTASVMNEEVEQLRRSGFDGAIAKPLDMATFPELIQKILRGDIVWHIT